MSRYGGPARSSADDLAYGDIPQRWDRDRFERFGARGPPPGPPPQRFQEDYRFEERDWPGRRDIAIADRIDERGLGGRYEERDRFFEESSRPRRRTDKELFGDVDPRELAGMALVPARRKSFSRPEGEHLDVSINRREAPPRPGLLRRQSSLDTFDRRPQRYERQEDYRMPPYQPVPLPIRRPRNEGFEEIRYRDYEPEDYREVEIQRERSVHRRRPPKSEARSEVAKSEYQSEESRSEAPKSEYKSEYKSEAPKSEAPKSEYKSEYKSVAPSHRSSRAKSRATKSVTTRHESPESESSESFEEIEKEESIRESIAETERKFKKGKTRMPKRLVRREAIQDLAYPYEEEEDFYVLKIALEKEQIDEVIKISEQYKEGGTKKVYRFDEKEEQVLSLPPPEQHEEVQRTEWVNPPTIIFGGGARTARTKSVREPSPSSRSTTTRRTSPARTHVTSHRSKSRRPSSPGTIVEERRTVIEDRGPPPPPPPPMSMYIPAPPMGPPPPQAPEFYEDRRTIIEERAPSRHSGALVVQEREYRSDRDINAEIRSLEAERRALRLEREAEEKRDMAVRLRERPEEEYQMVEYRERRPTREVLEVVERERSPDRKVVRVEKDRKERRKRKKVVAAAVGTLI